MGLDNNLRWQKKKMSELEDRLIELSYLKREGEKDWGK